MRSVNDFKYHVMCDFKGDGTMELAAWYDDLKKAEKEAKFLRSKGRKVEVVRNRL